MSSTAKKALLTNVCLSLGLILGQAIVECHTTIFNVGFVLIRPLSFVATLLSQQHTTTYTILLNAQVFSLKKFKNFTKKF